jgi:hypothetical protein
MIIVGSGSWNAGIAPEKGEGVDKEEGMKNTRQLSKNIVWLLKKFSHSVLQQVWQSKQMFLLQIISVQEQ